MEENKVSGLSDVDTREITKIIRDNGTMKAIITSEETPLEECLKLLNEYVLALFKETTNREVPIRRMSIAFGNVKPEEFASLTLFTDVEKEKESAVYSFFKQAIYFPLNLSRRTNTGIKNFPFPEKNLNICP